MWSWLVLVESNTTGSGRLFVAAGRALGLRPVVLTTDPSRYPYLAQDKVDRVLVDTGDIAALAGVTGKLAAVAPIAAVLSSSEYFVATAASLAIRHGRPAPNPIAVRRCRDKVWQRLVLAELPGSPRYVECADPQRAADATAWLGGTVVVKPCHGSGSAGVRQCAGPKEAASWAKRLLSRTTNERGLPTTPRVLVEELLVGPEYSVEMLDGEAWGVTAKHLGAAPYFVETGHDFPAELDARETRSLIETACRASHLLELHRGPAHVELRLTASGPVVVEVNPRLAGGMIPRLVELATGHDLIAAVISSATGRPLGRTPAATRYASIRFLCPTAEGVVRAITGLDRARSVDGVADVVCTASVGDEHRLSHSFRDRIGHVIAHADTATDAIAAAQAGCDAISVELHRFS
jgi:biotin carboxylase